MTPIPNPTTYINMVQGFDTVWARVENVNSPECFNTVSLDLLVNDSPDITDPITDLVVCDNDQDGVESFDLTSKEDEIQNTLVDISYTYHNSLADANNGTPFIANPTAYVSGGELIWVRAENIAGCFTVGTFNLVIDLVPEFVEVPEFIRCDNDGDGISNDNDDCPTVAGLPSNGCPDKDGDGYVDESEESDYPVDDCPDDFGTSHIDSYGCPDGDDDGWSDGNDPFPYDGTQWEDSDGDGYGDNADGEMSDDCPSRSGQSTQGGVLGCEDWDSDGWADHMDPYPQNGSMWSDEDGDGFADQQGTNISDNCPVEWGNSTLFRLGCPDMDGDGVPDNLDWDVDGDGYSNTDEMRSDPLSDPYDASDTPTDIDNDGRADTVEDSELASSSLMQDTFGKVVTGAVLLLVVFALALSIIMLNTNSGRRSTFERFERELMEAEGFEGLAEIEEELEKLLRRGSIRGSQGMLLRQRLDERRYALDEELRVSQQAQWWAAMGQQNQQWGGWYPTSEQAQWYAGQNEQGQYDPNQYDGQQ